ncbi:MAG: Crp/Fnr family transcriptional regulator [Thermodesulfobacteriota bacterium]
MVLKKGKELKNVSLFSELDATELALINTHCEEVSFPKDSFILREDDSGGDLYVILSGAAGIVIASRDGKEFLLDELKKGDFFGELSLLDGKRRSAAVVAQSDVRLLMLKRESFLKVMAKKAGIAIKLLSVTARRLREADEKIKMLSFLDAASRVEKAIAKIGETDGVRMADGRIKIAGVTHRMLAVRTGVSREAVTKAVKSLVSGGAVRLSGKGIVFFPVVLRRRENYLDNLSGVNCDDVEK